MPAPVGYTEDLVNAYVAGALPGDALTFTTFDSLGSPGPVALEGSVKIYDGEGWIDIGHLPDQAGNSGKVLTTDGTDATWVDISTLLPPP